MKWSRIEIVGALAFAALSLVLLLVPVIPLAGGTPHERPGERMAAQIEDVDFGIGVEEMSFDLEASPVPVRVFDLRDHAGYARWHLDGAETGSPSDLVSRVDTYCPRGSRVILYDGGPGSGVAAQTALLMRMNGCDAVWLREGVLAAMDYSGVPRPGKKDAPVREPPPRKKSPKKKPAKKAPRAGGEADEGC